LPAEAVYADATIREAAQASVCEASAAFVPFLCNCDSFVREPAPTEIPPSHARPKVK